MGVLRAHVPDRRRSFDDEDESAPVDGGAAANAGCSSCNKRADDALDVSLCGDPLMYATFVAPVQQYSSETEPSRQPSFNSRQPSFRQQNSAEAPHFPGLPRHAYADDHDDHVQDIFVPALPEASRTRNGNDFVEISQAELDRQVEQERLSFMSSSSNNASINNEDEDEEEDDVCEDLDAEDDEGFPPLPPLPATPTPPPVPPHKWRPREATPMVHDSKCWAESDDESAAAGVKCVGVRHLGVARSALGSRGTSPDDISESSLSFHENELLPKVRTLPPGGDCHSRTAQLIASDRAAAARPR